MLKAEAYDNNSMHSANQQQGSHGQNTLNQPQYRPFSINPDQSNHVRQGSNFKTQLMLLLIAATIVTALTFSLAAIYPSKMQDLVLQIDMLGFTDAGANEKARVRAIHALPITYEEKQVLVNQTVFLGATQEMVGLALGNPVCVQTSPAVSDVPETSHWVYFIEGDPKPTRLAFQEDRLISASKPSAMDVCK